MKKTEYPSYNGLGRSAMIAGIPLVPLVVIASVSMLLGLIVALFSGPGGLLFSGLGIPFLLYIKVISENDSNAIRAQWLELRCFIRHRNKNNYGGTYTLTPVRYGRKFDAYKRSFKQATRHITTVTKTVASCQ